MQGKKKIIITDDHQIFRLGLKSLIVKEDIADVVAEASNGQEFLNLLSKHKPDLVLMDIGMPEMDGIEATRKALDIDPNLKILVLSNFGDEVHYFNIIQAGAKGFVHKTSGIHELRAAIEKVMAGESYFSNELLRKIISNINSSGTFRNANGKSEDKLTRRELEVLQLVSNGLSNEEIADKLNISVTTVKGHRSNLLMKTGTKNTAGLIMFAIKNKIISC
jgi:DNA-binding NarL/FixJ family response regulator